MLTITVLQAVTENPAGDLKPGLEPSQVSPGIAGFIATFFLVAVVIFLIIDFNRRNRRLRYRAQYAEQRAAEEGVGGYAPSREGRAASGDITNSAARTTGPRSAPDARDSAGGGGSAARG